MQPIVWISRSPCCALWFLMQLCLPYAYPYVLDTLDKTVKRSLQSNPGEEQLLSSINLGNSLVGADTMGEDAQIEHALVMLDHMMSSIDMLKRKKADRRSQMPVGSGLLQQLDVLETIMRRRQMQTRLDKIEQIRRKFKEMG